MLLSFFFFFESIGWIFISQASITNSLICAYNLLDQVTVVPSVPASEEDIRGFHSEEYVQFLKTAEADREDVTEDEFGLGKEEERGRVKEWKINHFWFPKQIKMVKDCLLRSIIGISCSGLVTA